MLLFPQKDFLLVGILAIVLSFTLFGNGIGGDFVFDDTIVIVGNPLLGDPSKFLEIFTTPYFAYQPRPGLYRPLTIASYSLNTFIFGQSPVSFHITNVFLHAVVSFLVFVLLYKVKGKIVAFVGLLLFMFLPIHTEAVTSIIGRAEILALLFVLVALIFSLKERYILVSGSFFLGLLSKEIAIAFLPIFVFIEASRGLKTILKKVLYFVPAVVFYGILRYIALGNYFLQNDATSVYNPIKFAPFLRGLWTSFKVFYLYIEKTFYPVSLSSDYSFNQIKTVDKLISSPETIAGIFILTLIIIAFWKVKDFAFRLGIVTFLSSYFVISNWVFKTGTIMAERLIYTPSLGLVIMIVAIIQNAKIKMQNDPFDRTQGHPERSRTDDNLKFKILNLSPKLLLSTFYFLLSVVFVWYGFLIIDRNKDWLNDRSLYESAYAASPDSVVNKTNKAYLGFIDKNYTEAESRLNEILTIAPEHVSALNLAGQNYKKMGQHQKAEELWKKAIDLRKDYLRAYLSLGVLYYENGYFSSAEKVLTEAINIYPRWSEVLFLALSKVGLDKPDEAILLINRFSKNNLLRKEIKFAMGWAYFNKGDKEMAFRYFNQVKDPKMSMDDFLKTFEGSKVVILGEF